MLTPDPLGFFFVCLPLWSRKLEELLPRFGYDKDITAKDEFIHLVSCRSQKRAVRRHWVNKYSLTSSLICHPTEK